MARAKSVVLSKAEKKAVVVDLKAKIKAAKDEVKTISNDRKAAEKTFNTFVKTNDKAAAAAAKALAGLEASLASVTA